MRKRRRNKKRKIEHRFRPEERIANSSKKRVMIEEIIDKRRNGERETIDE